MAHEEEENEFEALAALLQKRSRQAVAFERRQVDEHGHAPDVAETSREKAALAIQAVARGSIGALITLTGSHYSTVTLCVLFSSATQDNTTSGNDLSGNVPLSRAVQPYAA